MKKILFILFTLSLLNTQLFSADYYWIGGDGNWSDINHWATSSGGAINHIQTPTANDNVFFDANSSTSNFTVTLNIGTIYCKDFNSSLLSNNLVLTGIVSQWKIYGSLILSNSISISSNPNLFFEAQTGNHSLKTFKKLGWRKLYFKGAATWTIQDTLQCGDIYLENGTLITNSNTVVASNLISNSNNPRNIELGASVITINTWGVSGNGYTVDAGTSKIFINGSVFNHNSNGAYTYYDITFNSFGNVMNQGLPIQFRKIEFKEDGSITGDNTIDSLLFRKGKEYTLESYRTQTINMALVANGNCKDPIIIRSQHSYASFHKASGVVDCNYLILSHIHATGGASFNAIGSIDNGDNDGWNITEPPSRDLYWVDDTGEWGDTTHWSAISGGNGGECIPTTVDNVFIDSLSLPLNGEIELKYIDGYCHNFLWTDSAYGLLVFSNNLNISGSIDLSSSTSLSSGGAIIFSSHDNGETVKTSNINLNSKQLIFNGYSGEWIIQDSINNTEGSINHHRGHLNTNSQYINISTLSVTGTESRELSLASSIIDIQANLFIEQDTLIVNPNTSHIRFLTGAPQIYTTGPNPDEFYNMTIAGDSTYAFSRTAGTIFNKIERFQDMILEGSIVSDTIILKKGKTYIYDERVDSISNALISIGDCHNVITIRDFTGNNTFGISMPASATVDVTNTAIRGCNAIGGAVFTANNSSDLGSNSGWIFSNTSQDHYWVNGNGNWQDSAHWSLNSGGASGACIPKIFDDVYFDLNSGFATGDSVIVDTNNTFCRNMNWTGVLGEPVFFDSSSYVHYISGDIKFVPEMSFECITETFLVGEQQNKTIESAGQSFMGDIIIADSGHWTLIDTLRVLTKINQYRGSFISAQNPIYTSSYFGVSDHYRKFDIQNNQLYITPGYLNKMFSWNMENNSILLATNSEIIFEEGGTIEVSGSSGQLVLNDVSFLGQKYGIIDHNNNISISFNNLDFVGDGEINGDNYIDSLYFHPGGNYILEAAMHQYINSYLLSSANCYNDIAISSGWGGAAIINCPQPISLNYTKLENITAIGPGPWIDNNGTDLGGNSSNWQIVPIPSRNLYWVADGGDWWDTAHWSLSTGGIGGECLPTYIDNVNFDSNSFITTYDTVLSSLGQIECHNMEWNYIVSEPFLDIQSLNIYGSLLLADTLDISSVNYINMRALDTGNVIRSKNNALPELSFLTDGAWSLEDELRAQRIIHDQGHFDSKGETISSLLYNSWTTKPRTLKIENSILNLNNSILIKTDSFNLFANNSNINFDNTGVPNFKFTIKGDNELAFHNVSFNKIMEGNTEVRNYSNSHHSFNKMTINNDATIYGEYIFDSLLFYAGNTYRLEKGKTQHINNYWFVRGNNCYALNLRSTKDNDQAFVTKNGGMVSADFMNVRDINVGGSSLYFAGSFSTDISNNTGWNFTNGPQYVYGLGADTSFTLGGNIVLTSNNFNGGPTTAYLWSTGSTASEITINQTGWYYITVSYAGDCTVFDSIYVGCDLIMNYNITNNLCFGDSIGSILALIPDSNYYYNYIWSNGDTTDFINGLGAGDYYVEVGADGGLCIVYDSLEITQAPQIYSPQTDTAFCLGDSVMLNLGDFQDFYWQDMHQGQYRWVSNADTFYIKVQDEDGCWSLLDTIDIRSDSPPNIGLGSDTTICMDETVELDAGAGFEEYLWSNNSAMRSITINNTGEYWVRVKERTCYAYDSIMVNNCPAKFIVPNVFTPNGDGYNDYFEIEYQNIWAFEIRVYSRWGLLVHKGSNLDMPWDGKILGQDAVEGVYFWHIYYEEYNGQGGGYDKKTVKGTVTIMK